MKKLESFLDTFFGIIFLILALPLAYVFLVIKIAWELATAWFKKIYEPDGLSRKERE